MNAQQLGQSGWYYDRSSFCRTCRGPAMRNPNRPQTLVCPTCEIRANEPQACTELFDFRKFVGPSAPVSAQAPAQAAS